MTDDEALELMELFRIVRSGDYTSEERKRLKELMMMQRRDENALDSKPRKKGGAK